MLRDGVREWDPPTPQPREVLWRHGHWIKRRERVREAISKSTRPEKRIARFDSCGAHGVVEWSPSRKKARCTCWHCHDRLCQPCMASRRRDIMQIVKNNTKGKRARFVTLTLAHSDASLKDEMRRLRKSFTKLRRSKLWRTYVEGGICVPETKIGKDGKWHHHMHMVTTGEYLDQAALSKAWQQATGDSVVVDIQFCSKLEETVWYITKYVTKPIDQTILEEPDKLIEFVDAIKGTRCFQTFGDWVSDAEDHEDPNENDWKPICTIPDLMRARDAGEPWALGLARQLQRELANLPPQLGP